MRSAVINSHTLGAIDAYRMVIKDVSSVIGDPVIDMQTIFYASMIQSGIGGFSVPEQYLDKVPESKTLAKRFSPVSFSKIEDTLNDLEKQIRSYSLIKDGDDKNMREMGDLIYFLRDLYVAAELGRPVVTAFQAPEIKKLEGVVRDDLLIVLQGLMAAVQSVTIDAPIVRLEVPVEKFKPFQEVLQSALFVPYVEGHELLANVREGESKGVSTIGRTARALVNAFPGELNLKQTSVAALQTIPAVVEASAGKVFGAVAKPVVDAISKAILGERRLLVYSFYPIWRQVWDAKLDKIRMMLQAERLAKNGAARSGNTKS